MFTVFIGNNYFR